MEERQLIIQFKEGDRNAFSKLYDIYFPKVFRFTQLYIISSIELADVVQEVFVKLWEKREQLDETKSIEGYLFIVTRNLIFNAARKSFNESAFKMTVLKASEDESYNLEEEIEASELKSYIDSLIQMLPPRRQEIFRLSREKQLTNKQIAELCGIGEKAVERQISFALKFLRENLPLFLLFCGVGHFKF